MYSNISDNYLNKSYAISGVELNVQFYLYNMKITYTNLCTSDDFGLMACLITTKKVSLYTMVYKDHI